MLKKVCWHEVSPLMGHSKYLKIRSTCMKESRGEMWRIRTEQSKVLVQQLRCIRKQMYKIQHVQLVACVESGEKQQMNFLVLWQLVFLHALESQESSRESGMSDSIQCQLCSYFADKLNFVTQYKQYKKKCVRLLSLPSATSQDSQGRSV